MQLDKGTGRFVTVDWHVFRERARRTESSEDVFSDIEQTRYDLDTARITGEENEDAYVENPYGEDLGPVNVREANPRRM